MPMHNLSPVAAAPLFVPAAAVTGAIADPLMRRQAVADHKAAE